MLPPRPRGCFRTDDAYWESFERWHRAAARQRMLQRATYVCVILTAVVLLVLLACGGGR